MTREQFISQVEGTQEAFRRFLVALCCGDSALADDVAQESYIKAYLSLGNFRDYDRFKSWIFRIGYTTFLNHKRSEREYAAYDDACGIDSDYESDSEFRYQDLYWALDQLPRRERISVLLFYMEGYHTKEIADIVDSSESAVRQHLSRGRNRLRELLSKL